MKTQNFLKAVTGSLLVIAAAGASAGHEADYRYDESSDTIVFSYHDSSASSPVQVASIGPVSLAQQNDAARDSHDWFRDQ